MPIENQPLEASSPSPEPTRSLTPTTTPTTKKRARGPGVEPITPGPQRLRMDSTISIDSAISSAASTSIPMSIEPQSNDMRQLPQPQQPPTSLTSVEPTPPQRIDTIAQQSLSFPSPLPVSNIAVVPPSANVLSVHVATHTAPPSPQISTATTTWPTQVSVSSSASSSTPPPVPPVVTAAKNAILEALRSNGDLAPVMTTYSRQNFAQSVRLIFKEGLPNDLKHRLRDKLRNLTRDTSAYFQDCDTNRILNNEGISTVLNYLRSRQTRTGGPLMTMPCRSLHNHDCINAIEHAITQAENSPQTFIVTNRLATSLTRRGIHDIDGGNAHRTPLLLLPMGNKRFRLLITDSVPGTYNEGLREDLNDLKIRLEQSGHTLEILFFAEKRQADSTNCPIFSLHDVVRFNTNRVRLQSIIAQTNPNTPVVLPLGFLIPTQSQTTVNRYIATHRENVPFTENAITRFRNRFERALEESSTQRQNRFIDRNMDRYEGIIWEHLLTTAAPTSQEAADIPISDFNNLANDRAAQYLDQMSNDRAATFLIQLPTERAATILANPNISTDVQTAILAVLMNNPSTIEKAKAIFAHPNLTITASRDILGCISLEKAIILADATLPLFSKRLLFRNMAPGRAASILAALGTARSTDILTTLIAYNAAQTIPILDALPLSSTAELTSVLPPARLAALLSSSNRTNYFSLEKVINILNNITPSAKADVLRALTACDTARALAILDALPELMNALPPERLATILSATDESSLLRPRPYNISLDSAVNILNRMTPSVKTDVLRALTACDTARTAAILDALPELTSALPPESLATILSATDKSSFLYPRPYYLSLDSAVNIFNRITPSARGDVLRALTACDTARAAAILDDLPPSSVIEFVNGLPSEDLAKILSSTEGERWGFNSTFHLSLEQAINILNNITPTSKVAAIMTHCDAWRAAAIFGNPSLQNATEIFANIASTSLSTVIQIIASFESYTQAAKLFNASAMAPYRTAFIADTTLSPYFAAKILTHADVAVSTAAQIFENTCLPTKRLIEIFSSSGMSQERRLQIMNHICQADVTTFLAFQLPRDTSAAATFLNTLDARKAAMLLTLCPVESQAAILNDNALISSKASEIFSAYPSDNQATIIDNTNLSFPRAIAIFVLLPRDKQANIITSYDLQPQRAALLLADPALDTIRSQIISSMETTRVKDIVAQDELPASIAAELLRAHGSQGAFILAQLPIQRANQIRPFM